MYITRSSINFIFCARTAVVLERVAGKRETLEVNTCVYYTHILLSSIDLYSINFSIHFYSVKFSTVVLERLA